MRGLTALAAIFTLAATAASPASAQRVSDVPAAPAAQAAAPAAAPAPASGGSASSAVEALGAAAAEEVRAQFRGPTRAAAESLGGAAPAAQALESAPTAAPTQAAAPAAQPAAAKPAAKPAPAIQPASLGQVAVAAPLTVQTTEPAAVSYYPQPQPYGAAPQGGYFPQPQAYQGQHQQLYPAQGQIQAQAPAVQAAVSPAHDVLIPGTPPQNLGWLPTPGPQPGAAAVSYDQFGGIHPLQQQPAQPYAHAPQAAAYAQPSYAAPAQPSAPAVAAADMMVLPTHQAVCVARQIESQIAQGTAQIALAFDQCRF